MNVIELNLTVDEIKKIKKEFKSGKVHTDGCFCGEAIANFRDNLYVVIDFSCRKSMRCKNSLYYEVNGIQVVEKALDSYSPEEVRDIFNSIINDESDNDTYKIDGREVVVIDDYNSTSKVDDIYLSCEGLKFSDDSLKAIQKKLFKYYKNTYGSYSEAKFKDVGQFTY